jgi:hypothetical protein
MDGRVVMRDGRIIAGDGARAEPRGDRLAAGARGHPRADRASVPDRVGAAVGHQGSGGIAAGAAATASYAALSGQPTVVPAASVAAGIGVALGTGALAGLYPAVRAARLAPAEALRAS